MLYAGAMATVDLLADPGTHLLALDLEATCDDGGAVPAREMETIEIGAIMVDADLKVVDEFQTFIRPVRRPRLTTFCTHLTSIRQADVDAAPYFREAMAAFKVWFSRFPGLRQWGSWGDYDRHQLERDCAFHGISASVHLPGRHVNLKEACTAALGLSKKPGLGQAIEAVGLSFAGTPHRGIDDARNIGRLLPYIFGRLAPPPRRRSPR